MHSIGLWWMWLSFFVFVVIVLAMDMFLLGGKRTHVVTVKDALVWSLVWVITAVIFGGMMWFYLNHSVSVDLATQKTLQFYTGFILEKSLSIDNLFVFLMIFRYFNVTLAHQHRVLIWGVIGAVVLRFVLIASGTWLVSEMHWILYLFGVFLVVTGIKMLLFADEEKDLSQSGLVQWLGRHLRMHTQMVGDRFFVRQNGLLYATPLFLVAVLVIISDIVFAADSIPAIFAITLDPFIVFTSNVFAILGLRAMYFLLAYMAERFHLLKFGIAVVLTFIGIKMLIVPWIEISTALSLSVVAVVLGCSLVLSLCYPPSGKRSIK